MGFNLWLVVGVWVGGFWLQVYFCIFYCGQVLFIVLLIYGVFMKKVYWDKVFKFVCYVKFEVLVDMVMVFMQCLFYLEEMFIFVVYEDGYYYFEDN